MKIAKRCPCCDHADLLRSPAILMPFVAKRVFGWEPIEISEELGFRDLRPGVAYSNCTTMGCRDCGFVFLDMRFDDEEMSALYADYRGEDYCRLRERFEPGYSARNAILNDGSTYLPVIEDFLRQHVPDQPRVLDWGGDTGLNTPFRGQASAHDVFEISGKPPILGARNVDAHQVRSETYDLIVCSQVLEHVPDPAAIVREMVEIMNRETLLYIELPHEALVREFGDVHQRVAHKRHWHEHINFFSSQSLSELLSSSNLMEVQKISHPVSAGGRTGHIFSIAARLKI